MPRDAARQGTIEPTHLSSRDRLALAFRIAGALAGLVIVVLGFATSTWNSARVIVPFSVVVIGGAVAYHLLTSVVRCPSCRSGVFNFRIGTEEENRKLFSCKRCGATAWLTEGFYWQRDSNG